ncbi:hypothetical protein V6N13_006083 [Hibiscus sabdariffa]|uniref:Uncharacterized protein n=1 Tax=Hibiscus sabdariffa TaxID=183260 RepID=A0ABR2ENU8_9ROSI
MVNPNSTFAGFTDTNLASNPSGRPPDETFGAMDVVLLENDESGIVNGAHLVDSLSDDNLVMDVVHDSLMADSIEGDKVDARVNAGLGLVISPSVPKANGEAGEGVIGQDEL